MGLSWSGLQTRGMGLMGGQTQMNITLTTTLDWHGDKIAELINKSSEEFLMAIAKDIMIAGKSFVHVITGTLSRSIKVDRPGEVQDRTEAAKTRDLGHPIPRPLRFGDKIALAVGGTTFYAIYEELLHPYMEPALAFARQGVDGNIEANKIP